MHNQTELSRIISTMSRTWDIHPHILFIKDTEFRYRYVNQAFLNLTGFTREHMLGKTGFEIFDDEEEKSERFHNADLEVINNGTIHKYQTSVERKGGLFHSLTTKVPILASDGRIIGIFGESRDISQLVNTKMELKNNFNLLETVMDTVPYPVFVKNLNHEYIRVNNAFSEEVQLPKKALYGRTDSDLYGEKNAELFESKDQEVFDKGKRVIFLTNRVSHKVNNQKFMIIKDPLYDDKGVIIGLVGIVDPSVNISDIQEQLINQQKIDAISLMAGGIAHDLNNMLTSIMGITSILKTDRLPSDMTDLVDIIHNSTLNATNMIKKLLTFSKKNPKQDVILKMSDQINGIVALITPNISSEINITVKIEDENLKILADPTQISQLLMNLILNASEAIEGEGEIDVSLISVVLDNIKDHNFILFPSELQSGEFMKLSVRDTGSGISEANQNRIFEPFFTTKESGTGLGLPVVYGVISAYSGLLEIDSRIGEGTNFQVYLPKYKAT